MSSADNGTDSLFSVEVAKVYEVVIQHIQDDLVLKMFRMMGLGDCHYLDTDLVCKRQRDVVVAYRYANESAAKVIQLGHTHGRSFQDVWRDVSLVCLSFVERDRKSVV